MSEANSESKSDTKVVTGASKRVDQITVEAFDSSLNTGVDFVVGAGEVTNLAIEEALETGVKFTSNSLKGADKMTTETTNAVLEEVTGKLSIESFTQSAKYADEITTKTSDAVLEEISGKFTMESMKESAKFADKVTTETVDAVLEETGKLASQAIKGFGSLFTQKKKELENEN